MVITDTILKHIDIEKEKTMKNIIHLILRNLYFFKN